MAKKVSKKIEVNTNDTVNFMMILQLIFITLKLTGHIHWTWFWTLSPTLLPIILAIAIGVLLYIIKKVRV